MEKLHNQITGLIVYSINNKKIKVAEAVLVLEMIKQDLVNQVSGSAYTKKPVKVIKKPTTIGAKDGIHKNKTCWRHNPNK